MLCVAIDGPQAQLSKFVPTTLAKSTRRSGAIAPRRRAVKRSAGGTARMSTKSLNGRIDGSVATEIELVCEQLANGDGKAFEALYREHREGLRRFFLRNCGSDALAQEMAQDVWFKVIRAVRCNSFHAYGSFTSYLYRIARNQLIDWYRRRGISPEVEMDEAMESRSDVIDFQRRTVSSPEKICGDQEAVRILVAAIAELPEIQRTTLMMYLESGMSYKEIADAMGTNRETVKSRLRYARRLLRERIGAD